ncbi:MAG: FtsQ-type POTRA domain-containing protein [Candidatus Peregrinibacteria bacterium]|nr:FtsQ-type POTRA domain-containing protein [Candidatus Peregrinibacteria bacterium]MDZ4244532.1 FtsQ-type POTRA domain-containing protein [Candidatus Gracilibacteria bacterium]
MIFRRKKTTKSKYTSYSSYTRGSDGRKFNPKKAGSLGGAIVSKNIKIIFKIFIILFLIVVVFFGGYYVFFSGSMIVKETALFENDIRIDHDIILSEINSHKGGSLLGINKMDLTTELKAKYPEIESVKIKKKMPDKLYVYISKYPAAANLIVKVDEVQRKYIINTEGSIMKADAEDNTLPYITMTRDKAYNSKEQIFTPGQLDKILKAEKLFEQKFGMQVIDVIYLEKAREFHLKTEKNFDVWLSLEIDYKSQLSKLKAAEQKLNINTEVLEYIDLRISGNNGEKVIFKRR